MFNLIATIICNTLLFVIIKFYPRFKIDTRQAIAANYWTCAITGYLLVDDFSMPSPGNTAWLPWAVVMGIMFITIFNLLAICTIRDGITTATVANKLSLVIPVIFSVLLYNEQLDALKIAGIIIAFPAVYLTTKTAGNEGKSGSLWLPAIIFIGSGLLDTSVKYVEHHYLDTQSAMISFIICMFAVAAIAGSIVVIVNAARGNTIIRLKNIIGGIILGVPNYFSLYFLVRLLNSGYFQSSAAIPLNNIGIVLVSALTGIFLFREKTTMARIIGLILSIVAIIFIAFADLNGRSI